MFWFPLYPSINMKMKERYGKIWSYKIHVCIPSWITTGLLCNFQPLVQFPLYKPHLLTNPFSITKSTSLSLFILSRYIYIYTSLWFFSFMWSYTLRAQLSWHLLTLPVSNPWFSPPNILEVSVSSFSWYTYIKGSSALIFEEVKSKMRVCTINKALHEYENARCTPNISLTFLCRIFKCFTLSIQSASFNSCSSHVSHSAAWSLDYSM